MRSPRPFVVPYVALGLGAWLAQSSSSGLFVLGVLLLTYVAWVISMQRLALKLIAKAFTKLQDKT